jgi:hypothetical protein
LTREDDVARLAVVIALPDWSIDPLPPVKIPVQFGGRPARFNQSVEEEYDGGDDP